MEIRPFNRDDIPNIDSGKLHTAVLAAETGKYLAGLIFMLFILVKVNLIHMFEKSENEFLQIMGVGFHVLLIIFFVLLLISFIESLIVLIFAARGEQDTPRMTMLLKVAGMLRGGVYYFLAFVFGLVFGGFGAFAVFAKNVNKDDGVEIFGVVFMLIGVGLAVSAVINFVKMLIKDLNS